MHGAGEPTAELFTCGTPEPRAPPLGSVCWVQALPDPAWRGFKAPPDTVCSSVPSGTHPPKNHEGPPRSFSEDLFSDISGKIHI